MICVHCHAKTQRSAPRCQGCGEDPLLAGRYRLDAVIGEGAAATLYRAWDTTRQSAVAVKERHPAGRLDAAASELFKREAKVLRQLKHPRIPAYVDAFAAGAGRAKRHYLIQTLVEGVSLDEELAGRRYAEAEVMDILREIAGILVYLHGLSPPVIHRDLKPGNVMRREDGALILVDFGAVRDHLAGTLGGQTVAGTFGYMAPEEFMGDATPASDIYALGALAVALLSRQDPAKLHDLQRRFRWERAVKVSEPVKALLTAMLSEDPSARPSASAITSWTARRAPAPPTTVSKKKTAKKKPPRGSLVPAEADKLDTLAEKGRRKLSRQQEKGEKEAIAKVTRRKRDAEKRLNEGLVGPVAGFFFRQQMFLHIGATMVVLLGGAYGIAHLYGIFLADSLPQWTALIIVFGALLAGFLIAAHASEWLLAPIARWACRRERERLSRLPVPIVLNDYLSQMKDFRHSGHAIMTVTLNEKISSERLTTLNEALQGSRLDGYASRSGETLTLKSKELDLTTLHGKSLNHAISHHSRIHAWNRKVLKRILLPAREELGIQSIRLHIKKS